MIRHHVLIVEDNPVIASQLGEFLEKSGFIVDFASSVSIAFNLLEQHTFDVVILDLMLPDGDGLTVCHKIKQEMRINTPVLMLTARDSLNEKLTGFEYGADDYLTKPFALEEVLVRCIALTKRQQLYQTNVIKIGDLEMDINQHTLSRQGQPISLSVTGFKLLEVLVNAYPNAVSKRQLTEKVWGCDTPESDAVRSHIYTLRNALDKPFNKAIIHTVHGIGFKLVANEE